MLAELPFFCIKISENILFYIFYFILVTTFLVFKENLLKLISIKKSLVIFEKKK